MRYTLTFEQARMRLMSSTAADCDPGLTGEQVAELIRMSRVPDAYGLRPADDGWTATYDVDYGASVGWEWKAAKVAALVDIQADGTSHKLSDLHKHCLEQSKRYASKIVTDTGVSESIADVVVN